MQFCSCPTPRGGAHDGATALAGSWEALLVQSSLPGLTGGGSRYAYSAHCLPYRDPVCVRPRVCLGVGTSYQNLNPCIILHWLTNLWRRKSLFIPSSEKQTTANTLHGQLPQGKLSCQPSLTPSDIYWDRLHQIRGSKKSLTVGSCLTHVPGQVTVSLCPGFLF